MTSLCAHCARSAGLEFNGTRVNCTAWMRVQEVRTECPRFKEMRGHPRPDLVTVAAKKARLDLRGARSEQRVDILIHACQRALINAGFAVPMPLVARYVEAVESELAVRV